MQTLTIDNTTDGNIILEWKTKEGKPMRHVVAPGERAEIEVNASVHMFAEGLPADTPVITLPADAELTSESSWEVATPGYGSGNGTVYMNRDGLLTDDGNTIRAGNWTPKVELPPIVKEKTL